MSDPLKKVCATAERPQQRQFIHCVNRDQRIPVEVCIKNDCSCTRLQDHQNREGENDNV